MTKPRIDPHIKVNRLRFFLDVGVKLFVGLIVLVALSDLTLIIIHQNENSKATTQKLDKGSEILHFLVDCTTPKGQCYQKGVASAAARQQQFELVVIAAAACARDPRNAGTFQEIETCVINRVGH